MVLRGAALAPASPDCSAYALAVLHGLAIWWGLGGREGLTNGWPLWRDDHPLYYHSALVTRAFLGPVGDHGRLRPQLHGGIRQERRLPRLVDAPRAGRLGLRAATTPRWPTSSTSWSRPRPSPGSSPRRGGPGGSGRSGRPRGVFLYLLYVWTDFPINYAALRDAPLPPGDPAGPAGDGASSRATWSEGGLAWWLVSAGLMSLCVLVHLTAAMVVAPAAALAYVAACLVGPDRSRPGGGVTGRTRARSATAAVSRHLGVWLIPIVVLAANAFWWLPGIWLASTKGRERLRVQPLAESVVARLVQIVTTEAPVQS